MVVIDAVGYAITTILSLVGLLAIARAGLRRPPPAGFTRCPLCHEAERYEDIVGGVCLTCADGIAFSQNARRASIVVEACVCLHSGPCRGPQWIEGSCPCLTVVTGEA